MGLSAGTRLGPYEITGVIGAGGMGAVYRARDDRLNRDVAIKVLLDSVAGDADRRARFEREAHAVAALNHPNILAIHDIGTHDGQMFVVTEFLEGETLRARLSTPLPVRKAVEIAAQIARGLSAAHDKGIVHRDLKPENVFLTRDGHVKILDFGLARQAATNSGATQTVSALTDPGVVMGTVGYMAPEQVRGQATDARTDIFALGAVVYEMLSGRRAFTGDTTADAMFAVVKSDPPELTTRPELSQALDRIVRHCLEKVPGDRFQSARDVAFALESLSASGPVSAAVTDSVARERRGLGLIPVAVGALLLVGAAFMTGRRSIADPPSLSSVSFQRKTHDPQMATSARFLHDGRTIVFSGSTQGDSPDLFVLRPEAPVPERLWPHTHLLSVSAKDELLVLTNATSLTWNFFSGTLALMKNVQSAPQPIGRDVRLADWGPDGTTKAVVREVGPLFQVEFPEGTVLYKTTGYVSNLRVSPDGKLVAFLDHTTRWDDRGWVSVVDAATPGHVTALAGDSVHQFVGQSGLAWARDSDTVLFTAADIGTHSLRAASVKAPGSFQMVMPAPGSVAIHDVADDGTWLIDRFNLRIGLRAAVPDEADERDFTFGGFTWAGFLSRDASRLLFVDPTAGNEYGVAVRNTKAGSKVQNLGPGNPCGLSPDGKWALAYLPTSLQVLAYNLDSGNQVTFNTTTLEHLSNSATPVWYPDSKSALVCGNERGRQPRCYRLPIDAGSPVPVTPEGVVLAFPNRDGSVLGQNADHVYALYRPNVNTPELVKGLTAEDIPVAWTSQDHVVLAGRNGVPFRLYKVDLRTGVRSLVRTLEPPDKAGVVSISGISLADDPKYYSYVYTQWLSELHTVTGTTALVRSR